MNVLFRKLALEDSNKLESLISVVEGALDDVAFWLPITPESRAHFFDAAWTDYFGAFVDGELVGASALFYDEYEFGESLEQLDLPPFRVVEIGRVMVHPEWRGNNIAYRLNEKLLELAKEKGAIYALATVHPQNYPSQRLFERLAFDRVCTYTKTCGFIRDIFLKRV